MLKKITTLLLILSCFYLGKAQETEFNLWQFAPASLNPALTGAYQGSFRVGGIVKDSWSSATDPQAYKALQAYVDAPIIRGFRKSDWVGVGLAFDMDQAGVPKQKANYQRASLAYHLGFGKKYKSSFTIAGMYTNKSRNIDLQSAITPNALNVAEITEEDVVTGVDQGEKSFEEDASNNTWTAAIGYRSQMNKRNSWAFGLSLAQFLTSDGSFGNAGDLGDRSARYIGYINFKSITGKRTSFEPQAVFSKQGASSRLYLQGIFGYVLKNNYVLKYGGGLNVLGALNVPLYAGVEKGPLKIGLAYSVSLSETEANKTYGGFELAASYIHILSKKPQPKPVIICPRL